MTREQPRFATIGEATAHARHVVATTGQVAWLVRLGPGWGVMTRSEVTLWEASTRTGRGRGTTGLRRAARGGGHRWRRAGDS